MTAKVYLLRTKHFNDNLAEKMERARENQMEHIMTNLSPRFQAIQDFNKGLSIDENPFTENTIDWTQYNTAWHDCHLIERITEQQSTHV